MRGVRESGMWIGVWIRKGKWFETEIFQGHLGGKILLTLHRSRMDSTIQKATRQAVMAVGHLAPPREEPLQAVAEEGAEVVRR